MISIFRVLSVDNKLGCDGRGTVKVRGEYLPPEYPAEDIDNIMVFRDYPAMFRIAYWQEMLWEMVHFSPGFGYAENHFIIVSPVPKQRLTLAVQDFQELVKLG